MQLRFFLIVNAVLELISTKGHAFSIPSVLERRRTIPIPSKLIRATALASSSSPSAGYPARKKTVQDRTPEEVQILIRDILKAVAEAGPAAGPRRTWDAYQAVSSTLRDFLPQWISTRTRRAVNSSSSPSLASNSGSSSPHNYRDSTSLPVILRTLFERLGSTYIKLGQFIASSPTLFPKEYVVEFQKCLDQTEPIPFSRIQQVLEDELGGATRLRNIFSYIDPKPLASASIAQVHVARLASTGEEVVIKVQKPGIDQSLKADLSFLYVLARVLEFLVPDWERTSFSLVAGDIRSSMLEELDFLKEARNTMEFRHFLAEFQLLDQATAPRVFMEYSTSKVLVMERLHGVSLLDETSIAKVTRRRNSSTTMGTEVVLNALNIWSLSVTQMPWFHADVHAGNLLLLDDGRVGFIDFGIVGRISEKVFRSVTELSTALSLGDSIGMAQALCNMGATDEAVDIPRFARDIERVLDKMTNLNVQTDIAVMQTAAATEPGIGRSSTTASISIDETEITDMLLELVEVTENNGLKLPREFGLLVKQSLYFDRYLKILAPDVDVLNDDRVVQFGGPSINTSSRRINSANRTGALPHTAGAVGENGRAQDTIIDV